MTLTPTPTSTTSTSTTYASDVELTARGRDAMGEVQGAITRIAKLVRDGQLEVAFEATPKVNVDRRGHVRSVSWVVQTRGRDHRVVDSIHATLLAFVTH